MNSNAGWLLAIGVGALVSFPVFPWILVSPCIISLSLLWLLVESPLWLLVRGRREEAVETLVALRGADYDFAEEIQELETAVNTENVSYFEVLKSGSRPLIIIFFLILFQTSSGCDTVSIYSLIIFSDFQISKHAFSLMFQGTVTLGYLLSPLVMLRLRRRPQLVLSSLAMSAGLVLVGLTSFLPTHYQTIVPVTGVVLAGVSYGAGVGSVPYALMSEIFPQRMKSLGLGLALSAKSLLTFCHIKAFPTLRSIIGIKNIFFLHSCILLVSMVFTVLCVPETRDKTVAQLEQIFRKKEKKRNNFSNVV